MLPSRPLLIKNSILKKEMMNIVIKQSLNSKNKCNALDWCPLIHGVRANYLLAEGGQMRVIIPFLKQAQTKKFADFTNRQKCLAT